MYTGTMVDEIVDTFSGDTTDGTIKRTFLTMTIINVTGQVWFCCKLETADLTIINFS